MLRLEMIWYLPPKATNLKVWNVARRRQGSAATVNSRLLRTLPSQRKKYTDERCITSSSARVRIKHQRQPSDDVSESNESGRRARRVWPA